MPEYEATFKRNAIAALASTRESLTGQKHKVSANKIDVYRNAGVIPGDMYKRPDPGDRIGYAYAEEAADWIAFARLLEKTTDLQVREVGAVLDTARDVFDHDLDAIVALYDKDKATLLCRLMKAGVKFKGQFDYLTGQAADECDNG